MVASGLVTAKETQRDDALKANKVPTDLELAAKHHKSAPNLFGGPDTLAQPADKAGELIQFKLRQAIKLRTIPLLDGARTKALLTNDDEPYAGGYSFIDQKKNALSPRHITLYDKDETAVALCLQAKGINIVGRQDFHVYSKFPMYEGQASKTVDGLDGQVYQWMTVQGIHEKPYYTIEAYKDKKEFDPLCFKASPKKVMSGMDKGIIVTSLHHENRLIAKLFHKKFISNDTSEGDVTGWDCKVAPGVDPLVIACITAVFDQLEGQNF